jgi:hypothetical protein
MIQRSIANSLNGRQTVLTSAVDERPLQGGSHSLQSKITTANGVVGFQVFDGRRVNDLALVDYCRVAREPKTKCMFCSAISSVDVLAMDGDDLRDLPLSMRKANLVRLLARRPDGIFVSDFEQGEIGPDLFRKACEFGLEGLVSKRRDKPYHAGRSKHWIKIKNRKHPAMSRVMEAFA